MMKSRSAGENNVNGSRCGRLLVLGLALLPPAALAYTAEEDLAYARAYAQCQEKRAVLLHRKQPLVPSELALEHAGGRVEGVNFHAYAGCKDALLAEPRRSSAASEAFDAGRAAADPDDWQRSTGGLPGLGPYTWVFFADLLLGVVCGILSQQYYDRRPPPAPPPGRLIPPSPPRAVAPGATVFKGTLIGLFVAFMAFGAGFICALFFMFLNPVPPLHLFLFTGLLIVVFALLRPRGGAGLLLPF